MRQLRLLAFAAVLVAASPALGRAQGTVSTTDSAAAGAERQIALGEQWFRSVCSACHAIGAVSNPDFRMKWSGRSAFDLFERIRSTMPENNPGSLSQGTYAAITAYLIKLNGIPVASRLVSTDSLALSALRLTFPTSPSGSGR